MNLYGSSGDFKISDPARSPRTGKSDAAADYNDLPF